MDCREFRKQHFAYLDDTLPGDEMSAAQRHVMGCDSCAAHDTMVRRSLMLVRNMSVIEPSADFRDRMAARLAETRAETQRERFQLAARQNELAAHRNARNFKQPVLFSAVAASVLVMGTFVWRQSTPKNAEVAVVPAVTPAIIAQPVVVDTIPQPIYLSPGMVQAMATGNPMWPAALLVDDTPAQIVNAEYSQFTQVRSLRD